MKIVEFGDFECPFCARFRNTVGAVRAAYPQQVNFVFVHLPLPAHRFAIPAAIAAECAAAQGRFSQFSDLAFAKQDSLGLKAWDSFAEEAGVADRIRFQQCISTAPPRQRIESGKALAKKLGASGTPTLFINGWRVHAGSDSTDLSRVIDELLSGRIPSASNK